MKNKGTFVVLRSAGLGNRIKSYVSHMARWENIKIEHPADARLFENFEQATEYDINNLPHTGSVWQLLVDKCEEKYIPDYRTIDFLFNKTPVYFREKYIPIFKSLKFNSEVEKMVNKFTENWDHYNMIGMNIRATTNSFNRDKFVTIEDFEKIADSFNINQKFFLCSDSIPIKNYFKNKYGDRCLTLDIDVIIDSGLTDDYEQSLIPLAEILILSKCKKKLFVTLGSTFSECAWWFGGCEAEVFTIANIDNISQDWYNAHMIKK